MSSDDAVKQQLYNRQGYVVGAETQRKYGEMRVLICGLSGLGTELAKNVILTGVKQVTLMDDAPLTLADLSTAFYATEAEVGTGRAKASEARLAELNRFVNVTTAAEGPDGLPSAELLAQHHVAVFCDKLTTQLGDVNAACRAAGVKMVACEGRGVCGSVFVDAGAEFVVNDTNGEETVTCVVTDITADGTVLCHEDKKHETVEGDKVYFTHVNGPAELNTAEGTAPVLFEIEKVNGPYTVKVKAPGIDLTAAPFRSGYMHTTKQPQTFSFKPLAASVEAPEFAFIDDDETKFFAAATLHTVFRACHAVEAEAAGAVAIAGRSTIAAPLNVDAVVAKAKAIDADVNAELVAQLASVFHGRINPMACFIGGFAAQEVLKCGSGKFSPVNQWLYYDVREVLQLLPDNAAQDRAPLECRYDGQIAVIGRDAQRALEEKSVFIVGAGALGCEHVKNVAMMGAGCGANSRVTITDMDTIELSNLSRQFLFRPHHIGKAKSTCAAESAVTINPKLRIDAKNEKVAGDTEAVFNEEFWEAHDIVLNALDNVQARKYVDERCVHFTRPLFESGTLGTKCNTQSVIPHVTENYGNSYDPPEKSIPLCTLKNFPNAIEHTIQWARDMFHGTFYAGPADANAYVEDDGFLGSLEKDPGNKPKVLQAVADLLTGRPATPRDSVVWARAKFDDCFNLGIRQLLHNMPPDMKTPDGTPFWGGAKKPPTPITFSAGEAGHVAFVAAAARLHAHMYGGMLTLSDEEIAAIAATLATPEFVPKVVKYVMSEKDKEEPASPTTAASPLPEVALPDRASAGARLIADEFEKDDDDNHHIAFITATSNLRAANYAIPPADLIRTKMIAGKIIPAMITTTALVTGLVGFEVLKYVLGAKDINTYRNGFVNIALPLMALTTPVAPPKGAEYVAADGREFKFTMWDRIEAGDGTDMSVGDVVSFIEDRYGLEICMMSTPAGQLVFNGLMPKPDVMAMPLTKRLEVVTKQPLDPRQKSVSLILNATANDEDVDLPAVRFRFRK